MVGAGVFAAFAPAASAAGWGLLVGLAIAAVIAYCNATASAQLAAQYPSSGGTYLYGRERLGAGWGFAAGWSFVIGKTASCAAMALTFAAYAAPAGWERPVAALAVAALVAVNYFGVTRTALLTRVLVVICLLVLAVVVAAGLSAPAAPISFAFVGGNPVTAWLAMNAPMDADAYAVLQSAGLLFFAFAGYARIATMGEEVRDPARTIPRAILGALAIAVAVYVVVAVVSLRTLGPEALGNSAAPLVDVAVAGGWDWAAPVVRFGAAAASLGALLALISGIGRTSLAMAREGDLPRALAAVHPRYRVPHRAELVLGAVVIAVVLVADLRGAIAFSSFGVLLYYFIANLSAFTQKSPDRRFPRWLQILGMVGCLVLVVTLPPLGIAAGVAVLAVGIGGRMLLRRVRA
ncbi:APC family permease [Mycetocola sp. CAN_C7]|uniref:APC family permease n=1 Tax=Mycetocola sp. CAN_C7 TaxID=2787724 RepID=UPI0018C9B334